MKELDNPIFIANRSYFALLKNIIFGFLSIFLAGRAFLLFLNPGSYSSSRIGFLSYLMRLGSEIPLAALILSLLLLCLGVFILWGSTAGFFPLKVYPTYFKVGVGLSVKTIHFQNVERIFNRVPGSVGLFIADDSSQETWVPMSYIKETPDEIEKILKDSFAEWGLKKHG